MIIRITKKSIFYIILFSLFLHLLFLVKHPGTIFNSPEALGFTEEIGIWGSRDAWLYAKMANQLIEHGVYGYDTHHTGQIVKNAFVTPGQPMYLVVIFTIASALHIDQMLLVKISNLILSVATVLLVYLISKKLFRNELMAILGALLYATYFSPLHYFRTALTEIPGIFFICLAIFLFLLAFETNRTNHHILFAISFCIAIMIRPTPAPLILFAIGAVVFKYGVKKSIRIGLLWLIGPALIILPWVIRNYVAFGKAYLFSSHGGNSIYAGANPFYIYDFSDYWREREAMGIAREDQGAYGLHKIKQGFKENPALWFSWFTIGKTFELFKSVDSKIHYFKYAGFALAQLQHYFVVIVGLISGFLFRKQKGVIVILIVLIGYICLSNLFLTITRYGYYIIPMLCILAGYGLGQILLKIPALKKWNDKMVHE